MGSKIPDRLGPFELREAIGEGGMGAVYRARHERDGSLAAVKVMTSERATEDWYRRSFRREAQALARLNHPNIATIYDFGTIDADLARRGPAALVEGAPWFAMEYVDGGSIEEPLGRWRWPVLEPFLLTLLDALAHAHARGIIHRDLKPSNILLEREANAAHIELVDFGVAHLSDPDVEQALGERENRVRGTPGFMAPEQIRGRWRDQGPWTDLYAVGCLVWMVVCRRVPFPGESSTEILEGHVHEQPGPFEPHIDVPEGLEEWLAHLLAKSPADRCRRAADAAAALLELSDHDYVPGSGVGSSDFDATTTTIGRSLGSPDLPEDTRVDESVQWTDDHPPDANDATAPAGAGVPPDWRRHRADDEPDPMSGAGLELFGLRRLPLVDRGKERDVLWRLLRTVDADHSPAGILLHGPAGCGKSRLVEWLCERAHELGAATALRATHSRAGGARDGLGSMFLRHFDCHGLDWSTAFERLRRKLSELGYDEERRLVEATGLLSLAGRSAGDDERQLGFQSARERNLALRRLLARLTRRRPVILWLDDIPWGRESADFARFLLEEADLPVLVVMTARDDALSEAPAALSWCRGSNAPAKSAPVAPLEADDQAALVRSMLHFEDQVVDRVVERTEGHPLFAVQLVRDWVEGGMLEMRDGRFVPADDAEIAIPDDLHRLWSRRLDQLLDRFTQSARAAVVHRLELAAVLGKHVDNDEWAAVCAAAGLEHSRAVVDQMLEGGLAERRSDGWSFAHGMLVASIRRRADDGGRLREWHRICASTLEEIYADRAQAIGERRADHWEAGGRPERAVDALDDAAEHWGAFRGDYNRSFDLLDRGDAILDDAGIGRDHRLRVRLLIRRGTHERIAGEVEDAKAHVGEAREIAERNGWPELVAVARLRLARLARMLADFEAGFEHLNAAESTFRRLDRETRLAQCSRTRGELNLHSRHMEEAMEAFDRARRQFERHGDPVRAQWCIRDIGTVQCETGRWRQAEKTLVPALERARELQALELEASCSNVLGEAARRRGEFDDAYERYRRAGELWELTGSVDALIARLNLAIVELEREHYQRADAVFADLADRFPDRGLEAWLPTVYAGRLVSAAGLGRWDDWDERLETFATQVADIKRPDPDIPDLTETAGDLCREHGESERARRIYRHARNVWRELDEEEAAERVSRKVDD